LKLERPVRASFELAPGLPAEEAARVGRALAAHGILAVSLVEVADSLGEALPAAARAIANAGRHVGAVVAPRALSSEALAALRLSGARDVDLRLRSMEDLADARASLAALEADPARRGPRLGLAVEGGAAAVSVLASLARGGLGREVERVSLLMPSSVPPGPAAFAGEREALRSSLESLSRSGVELVAHDPFLSELAGGGAHAGCQAGRALIHIGPTLDVFPCALIPLALGSIAERSLADILGSPQWRGLTGRLAAPPTGCRGCRLEASCAGGCRGRALALTGSFALMDPTCRVAASR
jgi:GeoRSP system SPASM domain protein